MVAHRIVTQQFYFQCLRISSVTLICFVYTPIEKMVGYVGNAPTQAVKPSDLQSELRL